MNKTSMRWLTISQSVVLFGTGMVFPFYVVFIKEVGANFTEFGLAYAFFALSSAVVHALIGKSSDKFGRKIFLLINSWGVAFLFLLFPLVTNIIQVYILQAILGVFGAMQKTSEKALVADFTDGKPRGKSIGIYHGWIAVFSSLAVIIGGYLIDLLTLEIIFYIGSFILFIGGLVIFKIRENEKIKN